MTPGRKLARLRPRTCGKFKGLWGSGQLSTSWPGKSAKRVFALDVPAIHVFRLRNKDDVDARHKAGHDDCS